MKSKLNRIYVKGGVLSPGELKQILSMAENMGLSTIKFGSRQDILLPSCDSDIDFNNEYPNLDIAINAPDRNQNIVCSYVTTDILPTTWWVKGTTYLYVLEQFNHTPKLKINITDPKQRLIPLFSGQLNFIASKNEDYWHLNLKLPNWDKEVEFPALIYTLDIPKVAEAIENLYEEASGIEELFKLVSDNTDTNSRTINEELELAFHPFPYYEGINKMGVDEYWLGLYWRNNEYDISFLNEFCDYCLESRIGKICITPWKSFIVKGINKKYKLNLEKLLGQSGINVRHSLLELNWHIPVDDKDAFKLKKFIVQNFDQNDISTYGLNFAISDKSNKEHYFTSAVIEKNEIPSIVKKYDVRPTYNVLYCKNFNPNTKEYLVYAQDVDKIELPGLLMELSKLYFSQLSEDEPKKIKKEKKKESIEVYQCKDCKTIYDKEFGDISQGIDPGVDFNDLDSSYECPLCEAEKSNYELVTLQK